MKLPNKIVYKHYEKHRIEIDFKKRYIMITNRLKIPFSEKNIEKVHLYTKDYLYHINERVKVINKRLNVTSLYKENLYDDLGQINGYVTYKPCSDELRAKFEAEKEYLFKQYSRIKVLDLRDFI